MGFHFRCLSQHIKKHVLCIGGSIQIHLLSRRSNLRSVSLHCNRHINSFVLVLMGFVSLRDLLDVPGTPLRLVCHVIVTLLRYRVRFHVSVSTRLLCRTLDSKACLCQAVVCRRSSCGTCCGPPTAFPRTGPRVPRVSLPGRQTVQDDSVTKRQPHCRVGWSRVVV